MCWLSGTCGAAWMWTYDKWKLFMTMVAHITQQEWSFCSIYWNCIFGKFNKLFPKNHMKVIAEKVFVRYFLFFCYISSMILGIAMSVCWSVYLCQTEIYQLLNGVPHTFMAPRGWILTFCDPLTFYLAPLLGQNFTSFNTLVLTKSLQNKWLSHLARVC